MYCVCVHMYIHGYWNASFTLWKISHCTNLKLTKSTYIQTRKKEKKEKSNMFSFNFDNLADIFLPKKNLEYIFLIVYFLSLN